MLRFSEFITESGDSHYNFWHSGHTQYDDDESDHAYRFRDHKDVPHTVNIYTNKHKSSVDFSKANNIEATGDAGHSAVKTFSTVKKIIGHHLARHPKVTEVNFIASENLPSRHRLYDRFADMNGGTKERHSSDYSHYTIPASRLREETIIESGDSHYPYSKEDSVHPGRHFYRFHDPKSNSHIRVFIEHGASGKTASVSFKPTDTSSYEATHKSGHGAVKTFATVRKIMKDHADKHGIESYSFESSHSEPSRVKLYTRMMRKQGGKSADGFRSAHHQIYSKDL